MHLIKHFIALAIACHCLAPLGSAETITKHLAIPDGTLEHRATPTDVGIYAEEIIWHPKRGGHERVYSTGGKKSDDHAWTIEAAFASEGVLSLCRGASTGALEHWQFRKSGPDWKLVARAFLGSGTGVYGITMPDAQTIEFKREDRTIDRLTVTNRPIGGTSLYREVMINGKELRPYSRDASATVTTGEKVPELSSPQGTVPPLKSVPASAPDHPSKLYDSFLKLPPPKELSTPRDKRGWGAMQQIVLSPKYFAASDMMESGDKATLERIWREFASMTETDQQVIGMTADSTQDLGQVSAITSAVQGAKSEEIKELLLDGASRIVVHALIDPVRRDAAQNVAQKLTSSGLARPMLLDALAKQKPK